MLHVEKKLHSDETYFAFFYMLFLLHFTKAQVCMNMFMVLLYEVIPQLNWSE